jgi:hypothetical protein
MKASLWVGLVAIFILTGCANPNRRSIAKSEASATKRVFNAPYNTVWRAAVDAAQQGDLDVVTADRPRGYIGVRSGAASKENVGVWVRSLGPSGTEVEVSGRPGMKSSRAWAGEMMDAIAFNVARGPAAVGGTGPQVYIENHVAPESTTVIPELRDSAAKSAPQNSLSNSRGLEKLREVERRIADLRQRQSEREAELRPEQDENRRDEIRAEIERLREQLRIQEERLKELDRNPR